MERLILLFVGLILALPLSAQEEVKDYWPTYEECEAAVDADFYYPDITRQRPRNPDEGVRGIPRNACVWMDLPDRLGLGGIGWVRIETGRAFYQNLVTREWLSLAQCNNTVYEIRYLPSPESVVFLPGEPGPPGPMGPPGPQGPPGETVYVSIPYSPSWWVRNRDWFVPTSVGVAVIGGFVCAKHCRSRSSASSYAGADTNIWINGIQYSP